MIRARQARRTIEPQLLDRRDLIGSVDQRDQRGSRLMKGQTTERFAVARSNR
jgi:hypothetical protein